MSALLEEIINLASDSKESLPDMLRKCLQLGYELKNDQLKQWANQELNGYKSAENLPPYRIIPAPAKGNFIGPGLMQYNNHIIPPISLEKNHRELAETVYLFQSVSAYTDMMSKSASTKGDLIQPWPANMVLYYQERLMQNGFVCHSAWQVISVSAIVELLDAVRNRTLNMALQIRVELGGSEADLRNVEKLHAEEIESIVIQNTGGGSVYVTFGHAAISSTRADTVINVGDREGLDRLLRGVGMDNHDLDGLSEAMKADGPKPDKNVGEWVKDKASKVLAGGVKVGTTIGAEIITAWIKQHYGIY